MSNGNFSHSFTKASCIGTNFSITNGSYISISIDDGLSTYEWNDSVGHRISKDFDALIKKTFKDFKSSWSSLEDVDRKLASGAKNFSYDSGYYHSLMDSCRF